jgi:putative membrane protein
MSILVLNVDRDDDFGRKAHIKSPIIGLKDNINAAQLFGEADPEDSDLNAIYYAISVYKKMVEQGKKVEIATICGHINVGITSDEILSNQLEDVLHKTKSDQVILVSDGAEDDYIIPIIQSRVKITSIQRVSVKQSKQIEDAYYRILKMLDDVKVQKQFLLPIALVLIVWAFIVILDMTSSGLGAMLLTLGVYLLVRVFHWEKSISYFLHDIKSGFLTGKLSLYTSIISGVIIIASVFLSYNNTDFSSEYQMLSVLSFLSNMIVGVVIAGLLFIFGHVVDSYVKDKKAPWSYWIYPFSLLAFGFISSAIFETLYNALINWPEVFYIEQFYNSFFILNTMTGIMIAIVGAVTYHYIKDMYKTEKKDFEVEKQTI